MRHILNVTIGTIVERRLINKAKLKPIKDDVVLEKMVMSRLVQEVTNNLDTIPTDEADIQRWAIAFVQGVDLQLLRAGYWAELPWILDNLITTGEFTVDKDISHD